MLICVTVRIYKTYVLHVRLINIFIPRILKENNYILQLYHNKDFQKMKMSVTEMEEKDRREEREQERWKKREKWMKAAKPERSSLPPSHIRILILMRLPVFPPSVFPLSRFEHEKLKKHKFQ